MAIQKRKCSKNFKREKKTVRAAGYVRVSTEEQAKFGLSIAEQKASVEGFCHTYPIALEIYDDEGFSAKTSNRPSFQKMMADAKTKKFDIIICTRLDRISRNVADFSSLIDELNDINIGFISIKEQFDTTTPMGRAMMYIASVFAQLERETIAERVADALEFRAQQGKTTATGVLGYDRVGNELTVNLVEAKLVNLIFELYAKNKSLTTTRNLVNDLGHKGKFGSPFQASSIKLILNNKIYLGFNNWHGCQIQASHDPIICQSLWDTVHGV